MACHHILVNLEHGQCICAFLRTSGCNYSGHVNTSQKLRYPSPEGWRRTGVLIGCAPDRSNGVMLQLPLIGMTGRSAAVSRLPRLCRTVSRISWRTCVAHLLSDHRHAR